MRKTLIILGLLLVMLNVGFSQEKRQKADGWIFANYVWNNDQTEATFNLDGAITNVTWTQNGETKNVAYHIPPESECFTCHKINAEPMPIGPKPQNLNKSITYAEGTLNQLEKWQQYGYLEQNIPYTINSTVNWEDTTQPIDLRMRSYVDINCAHCHSDYAHCNYRPMRFPFHENNDETNLGVCVEPEEQFGGLNYIVVPGNINRSMLYFRVSTTNDQRKMPLLGRTLVQEEAIAMIEEWINSISTTCQ